MSFIYSVDDNDLVKSLSNIYYNEKVNIKGAFVLQHTTQ